MNIGTTIKKLRRAKDMTQETLAEYLGVSVSAVSQWEAEKTAPDLSLISPLCNLLEVTADELLGIDLEAKQKKIREILNNAYSFESRGYTTEAHDILTEGLRQFPDSFELMERSLFIHFYLMDEDDLSEEEHNEARDEAIRLGELILEKCLDDKKRHSAIQILCYLYPKIGKKDRAIELASKMPVMAVSKDFLFARINRGSEGYRCDKALIYNLIQFLSNDMVSKQRMRDNGEFFYSDDDMAALREKQIAFLNLMFENGDMGFYHCFLASTHSEQAKYYARKMDGANTLTHLSKAADQAIGFVKYAAQESFVHTSLLFREYETSGTSFSTDSKENDAMQLLNEMTYSEFDFIRDDAEFRKIADCLKEYAGKWNPAEVE